MRSPIAEACSEPQNYSDLCVMSSAAGYFIGTYYKDPRYNWAEPGSRDSEYFATREAAQAALANGTWTQREHP